VNKAQEAAIERACDIDRAYFKSHPDATEYVRAYIPNEMVSRCRRVRVVQIKPGIRARIPEEIF
jgi:hypothetical protein